MIEAIKSVAEVVPGDPETTESELLSALRLHAQEDETQNQTNIK